jgi:hypothetical protein
MSLRSFGIVTVTTGGTPVQATAGLTLDTGEPVPLQSLRVQAHPDNSAVVYIFTQMAQPPVDQRATGVGLVAVLPDPASATAGPFEAYEVSLPATPNGLDLRNIWFDAGGNGQKVIVSGTVG